MFASVGSINSLLNERDDANMLNKCKQLYLMNSGYQSYEPIMYFLCRMVTTSKLSLKRHNRLRKTFDSISSNEPCLSTQMCRSKNMFKELDQTSEFYP